MNKLLLTIFIFISIFFGVCATHAGYARDAVPVLQELFSSPHKQEAEQEISDDQSSSAWQSALDDAVRVRLISNDTAVSGDGKLSLALEIVLAPEWKTYWRFPGVAGFPASITWQNSSNLADKDQPARFQWPAPHRFQFAGLESYGYKERVVLPFNLSVLDPFQPVDLKAHVELMACKELCVPFSFDLSLQLKPGIAAPSPWHSMIEEWQNRVPTVITGLTASHEKLDIEDAYVNKGQLVVDVHQAQQELLHDVDLFIDNLTLPPPSISDQNPSRLIIDLKGHDESKLIGRNLTLTLVSGEQHIEKNIVVHAYSAQNHSIFSLVILINAIFAAFIGGLILNLMPCVLPVLSLKVLSAIGHANNPPHHVRMSFLASAAGIITSFLCLALVAIAFLEAGYQIGWGVQFQNPIFLGVLVVVLTLFAASLWDLVQIPLPRFIANALADRLPNYAKGEHEGFFGHFLTGAFATLLATPCSAPFVGTAIGFALSGGPASILLIALSMGLGLAMPYLLVAAFPQSARIFPRPGRWMNILKALLGTALMFTALWLSYILSSSLEPNILLVMMVRGGVLLMLLVFWIRASIQRPVLVIKGVVFIAFLSVALHGITLMQNKFSFDPMAHRSINWIAFDPDVVPLLVRSNKTILVDVTAEWCLSCHANKKLVLDRDPVHMKLTTDLNIITMQGDWTKPNPQISDFLKRYGRYGIPFDIVYGPGAPDGIVLPELLTTHAVMSALAQAAEVP